MKVAFLFPGQGAQKVGMGREFFEYSSAARSVFQEADDTLNEPLSRLLFEGPIEDLTLTANTQPATVTVSIAALAAFSEQTDIVPEFVAGHSSGEYSALVASNAMSFRDAIYVTRTRGALMQETVPLGQGMMAAVIGKLSHERIAKTCKEVSLNEIVAPANFNCPGQVVISGNTGAVKRASECLRDKGVKVIPLKVSAPFHCPLMAPTADSIGRILDEITFKDPDIPIVTNVEGQPNKDKNRIRELLVKQITSPVLWSASIQTMLDAGIDTFFEFGSGNVLYGLLRRIDRSARIVSVNSKEGLDKAMEALEKV